MTTKNYQLKFSKKGLPRLDATAKNLSEVKTEMKSFLNENDLTAAQVGMNCGKLFLDGVLIGTVDYNGKILKDAKVEKTSKTKKVSKPTAKTKTTKKVSKPTKKVSKPTKTVAEKVSKVEKESKLFKNEIRKPRVKETFCVQRYNKKDKRFEISIGDTVILHHERYDKGHVRFWRSKRIDKLNVNLLYVIGLDGQLDYVFRKSDDTVLWARSLEVLQTANRKEKLWNYGNKKSS